MKTKSPLMILCALAACAAVASSQPNTYEVDSISIDGGADPKGGRIAIVASIGDPVDDPAEEQLIYSLRSDSRLRVEPDSVSQTIDLTAEVKHGRLERMVLSVRGGLPIERVSGDNIAAWSLQRPSSDAEEASVESLRLVIDLVEPVESGQVNCVVEARQAEATLPMAVDAVFLNPPDPSLNAGSLRIETADTIRVETSAAAEITENERKGSAATHDYSFSGGGQELVLRAESKTRPDLAFRDFELTGRQEAGRFRFRLDGVVEVYNPGTQRLPLLSGEAAFTAVPEIEDASIRYEAGGYLAEFDAPGRYPLMIEFDARVRTQAGRSSVRFELMDSALQPVTLRNLSGDPARLRLNGMPLESGEGGLTGSLSGNGRFELVWTDPSWKSPKPGDASLFYAAESISQLTVGPGLLRQSAEYRITLMQGAMRELRFRIEGEGEITEVEGAAVLGWEVVEADAGRELQLMLNKAYTEDFEVTVRSQHALGAFPAEVPPLRLAPVDAIRYGGFIRITNQGAVSVDVPESSGFAQISPEYFPAATEALPEGTQVLAYRFSDAKHRYTLRAEDILPEVALSQVLVYSVGAEDQRLEAELELMIRKAPLRDFYIEVPEGYALSNLDAPSLADYFLLDSEDGRELRLVFEEPVSGRRVVRLTMENNRSLDGERWALPTFRPLNVKSIRGHVGVVAEPGLRVVAETTEGLIEQAVNFFPRTAEGLQLALRLREAEWSAVLAVEALPQAIQADVLHLYTVGEGRIYGSSVINYLISGAPVSNFRIRVPEAMENLDFVGRDIRGWSELGEGVYEVRLHASASGAYSLLASYESKFESQGETVSFTGAEPLDVASEQGFVVAVSNFPFSLAAVDMAEGMIRLEPNEIPAEFRLLYDAQVLGAFQYTQRPMEVRMGLKSFAQAEATDQVIDFAELKSHISRDGEILTSVELMLKSKGRTHFRMQLPPEHRIWSAQVDGRKVNPVSVEGGILLPLPAGRDPDSALRVRLELAAESSDAARPTVYAPAMYAPSLTLNWELSADPGYGLSYLEGDISSGQMSPRDKGFDWLRAVLSGERPLVRVFLIAMLLVGFAGLLAARLLRARFFEFRVFTRGVLILTVLAALAGLTLCAIVLGSVPTARDGLHERIALQAPIELSTEPLRLELVNRPVAEGLAGSISVVPVLLGLMLWGVGFAKPEHRNAWFAAGWMFLFLGALNTSGGAAFFLVLLVLFFLVHCLRPLKDLMLRRTATAAVVILSISGSLLAPGEADAKTAVRPEAATAAESLTERIRVEGGWAEVEAELKWRAGPGERHTFLTAPGTLVDAAPLPEGLRLMQDREGDLLRYALEARAAGDYSFRFSYRVPVTSTSNGAKTLQLPVGLALSHRASLSLPSTNVTLESPQIVSNQLEASGADGRSEFELVFLPSTQTSLTWAPEQRDASKERAVYHVESHDLFTPLVGLVGGRHRLNVRLSQGQLDALELAVPEEMTVTAAEGEGIAGWRFDPEASRVFVYFEPVRQGRFSFEVFSQYAAASLPYEATVRPPRVLGAASQLSLVALASDDDVQIGQVETVEATAINLEDFPGELSAASTHPEREPKLRRAYRWDAESGALKLQALAVEPNIRSVAKQTVSLGEDRVLLSLELQVEIRRAGVFRLSLPIPEAYDVEAVSGQHLSHWSESPDAQGRRMLQLHLRGKTMGATNFNLSLSGPGLTERTSYAPPILQLAETDRQSGSLMLIPELGYRLQATERDAAIQMDPAQAGVQRKSVLLYRILNQDARLAFEVERVEPWIEVERVQSVAVRSGVVEVRALYHFDVENAGVREQVFRLPEEAMGVRFSGDALGDSEESEPGLWRVMLDRRMVGGFTLELSYRIPTPDQPKELSIAGVELPGVNQQSGYFVLVPKGRIQLDPRSVPGALQPAEAHMIEPRLRGDLAVAEASHVYRVLEPRFQIGLRVMRHEIADLVPAQVRDVKLASTLSGDGSMLTQVSLKLDPGDKRMLRIGLPPDSEFWFGFVNQQSVWPWREGDDILLQLESSPIEGDDATVEFFYATRSLLGDRPRLDATLRGPRLDLPLENISWTLHYPETWEVRDWDGTMTVDQTRLERGDFADLSGYLQSEQKSRSIKKSKAEHLLNEANQMLELGRQEQARKAFSSAYNLSQSDEALNEDARVQLQNVREQQALVALANRRNSFINANAATPQAQRQVEIGDDQLLHYTDQELEGVLGGNSLEENEALRLLAARLIDQQQAAPSRPQAIHSLLPPQGHTVSFSRSLQIHDNAELVIELAGRRRDGRAGLPWLGLILLAVFAFGVTCLSNDRAG